MQGESGNEHAIDESHLADISDCGNARGNVAGTDGCPPSSGGAVLSPPLVAPDGSSTPMGILLSADDHPDAFGWVSRYRSSWNAYLASHPAGRR